VNGDGEITFPEIEGDVNGDGTLDCFDLILVGIPVNTAISVENGTITAEADQGVTYQWMDCVSGELLAGETAQSFTATENGLYRVIITDNFTGCSDTSNCALISNVSIAQRGVTPLELFPNPSSEVFSVNGLSQTALIEIRDGAGRLILSRVSKETKEVFSSQDMASGVYFVIVISESKRETLRLVVAH
jgi:hypothetical protein